MSHHIVRRASIFVIVFFGWSHLRNFHGGKIRLHFWIMERWDFNANPPPRDTADWAGPSAGVSLRTTFLCYQDQGREMLPQWGQGYSDYQLVHSVQAGVGPDWSPARGVETRNTMDRCPGRGSSIDLIIAWMFIFCRPQHQQSASRPHTAYFKSSHPLKPNTQIHISMFLFSNDFDSWTGVMKPSQAHYTGH